MKMTRKLVLGGMVVAGLVLSIAMTPNGSGLAEDTEQEPEQSVVGPVHRSEIRYWQTYSASPQGGVHEWIDSGAEYVISEVQTEQVARSGLLYTTGDRLIGRDLADGSQWIIEGEERELFGSGLAYRAGEREFLHDYLNSLLTACSLDAAEGCISVVIPEGTWPYVWADAGGAVVAITNYGLAMLFKDGEWQQMFRHGDIYDLDSRNADVLENRPTQFYSSLHFQGRTLLGEWPTGRLYEFDGERIVPSPLSVPRLEALADQRLGFEAQSMAEYCGDLFVGYWPRGEVFRMDGQTQEWELFHRFFTGLTRMPTFAPEWSTYDDTYETELLIPYKARPYDDLDGAFFGQRITALVPWEYSLWVATSNLRSWGEHISPQVPSWRIQEEYGKVHKITKSGCVTTYGQPE